MRGNWGVKDLDGSAAGCGGVVVSAGPSLTRNLHRLARPGIRERVLIVATQTVLKTMLSAGIRPHFVCALDHSPLCARFYEGLNAADVQGVQLVVTADANPCIPRAWPGKYRMPGDPTADMIVGEDLSAVYGTLPRASTVAAMAYHLCRLCGCDPVILVGQDLAFTDGQYYHAGAAIHQVWSGELGEFVSIEQREWERIARTKDMNPKVKDRRGRDVYTDVQMASYLIAMEGLFGIDAAKGLTVLDATEGGCAKAHTTAIPLSDALDRVWGGTLRLPPSFHMGAVAVPWREVEATAIKGAILAGRVGSAGAYGLTGTI